MLHYFYFSVDSNDVLYGREPQFVTDVDSMCTVLLDNVLEQLKSLTDRPDYQVICCVPFCDTNNNAI